VNSAHYALNSAILAGGAVAIALPVGTLLAVLIVKLALPGRWPAAVALGALLLMPLWVQLSGWDAALGKLGWLTLAFGSGPRSWLEGMTGAIFIHGVAGVPWVALIVGLGLAQVDRAQEEAALLESSPLAVLARITLPQCWSFVIAAALWVAISTATEMTVTNIYVIDPAQWTFTEQFYMNYSLAGDARPAVIAVLPALAGLVLVILATFWLLGRLASARITAGMSRSVTIPVGAASGLLTALLWSIVLVLVVVPLASLVIKAGFYVQQSGAAPQPGWSAAEAWEVVRQTPDRFSEEFRWTAMISLPAATLAIAIALALAWPARRGGWHALPAMLVSTVCLATPGPLVGAAIIALFDVPWSDVLFWLYDDTLVPTILATTVRSLPLSILLVWHCLATLCDDELAAAALEGAGTLSALWRIALPQRWPAMGGVWLAALAISAGDLAWSHLVAPPGVDTLPRRVFGLVHIGVEEQVAGICLVVIAGYAAVAGLVLSVWRWRSYTAL
jgi:iron(III) transport system permease protein